MELDTETEIELIVDSRNKLPNNNCSILNILPDPEKTSSKYAITDDLAVVKTLNESGWFINKYKQVRSKDLNKSKYKTYVATYTNPTLPQVNGEGSLTLLQRGSHDGSKSLLLQLGFFRAVCENGLIVGNSLFEPISIRHVGNKPSFLGSVVNKLITAAPTLATRIHEFSNVTLTDKQKLDFAAQARNLRFGTSLVVEPKDLLQVSRHADVGNSLWTVLNVVQEHLIKPKQTGLIGTNSNNKKRKLRNITNIDLDFKINVGLWELAESTLKALY